jgi:hypothetical protein
MTVCATGAVQGSIVRVERSLRDGTTGDLLGRRSDDGPFVGYTKTGVVDPLRDSGSQRLDFSFDSGPNRLGFAGNRSLLLTEVIIKETTGLERTVSGQFEVDRFPVPVLRSPVGVVVRQNDPRSGCSFDPINGYGILLEIDWESPPGGLGIDDYVVAVADGAGTEIIWPFYAHTAETALRFVRCDLHVPQGAQRGARVAVSAVSSTYRTMSGWALARFDFQPCRDAGVPDCR